METFRAMTKCCCSWWLTMYCTPLIIDTLFIIQSCFPSMSYESRLKGFVMCFITGWVLSFCSVIAVSLGNINGFVLLYSFGNVIAILATGFLMGPCRQLKSMFASVRIVATLIFIGLLIGTIVVAVQTKNFVAVLIMVILQFFAGLWYSLSYIPFGKSTTMNISCFNPADFK